jgi:hypothetical protein
MERVPLGLKDLDHSVVSSLAGIQTMNPYLPVAGSIVIAACGTG